MTRNRPMAAADRLAVERIHAQGIEDREATGFRVVGRRERMAKSGAGPHAGRWRDTILIERRSLTVGVDPEAAP